MSNTGNSSPVLINCDFTENAVDNVGAAIATFDSSSAVLINCILWGDLATNSGEVYVDPTSAASITYSDIQGDYSGAGNIDGNPLFVKPLLPEIGNTSPCINAGSNAGVPSGVTTDLAGNPRIVDGIVDMGAYEAQSNIMSWTGVGDGTSWSDPNNWSGGSVPNRLSDISIPSGVPIVQIAGGSFSANSINSESPISVNGAALTLFGPSSIDTSLIIINGGTIDITNASLAVDYGVNSSPLTAIQNYVASGAIFSSIANANSQDAVGIADGSLDAGTAAQPGQVLVKYTLDGDANLDGLVNFQDLVTVIQNFNKGGTDWAGGNFTYGPSTNFQDLVAVVQNFNKTLSPPAASSAAQTGVQTIPLGQSAAVEVQKKPAAAINLYQNPTASQAPATFTDTETEILQSGSTLQSILAD
jgi:hypothetical protein